MVSYRYSRWDGSQEVFPVHEDEIMELLSDQQVAQGDVASALRNLIQHGTRASSEHRFSGTRDLLQRLRSHRQELLSRYDLDSVLKEIEKRLQDVIDTERQGIQQRLDEVSARVQEPHGDDGVSQEKREELLGLLKRQAGRSRDFLYELPGEVAGRLEKLSGYEFMDPQAKAKFDDIIASLQKQVLESHFNELSQQVQSMGPQFNQGLKGLLQDLNSMLEARLDGQGQAEFDRFMRKHGRLFGQDPPTSLDGLVRQMQRQTAQMQSLLRSITPEQRQELQGMLEAVFGDPELRREIARLDAVLDALDPLGALNREYSFSGSDSLTLEEAINLMDRLQDIEEAESQLRRAQQSVTLEEVDGELLRKLLGAEALQELQQLKRLRSVLEEAGYIRRAGSRYELTPKGMRRIGQKALKELFTSIIRDRTGGHDTRSLGTGADHQDEASKPYEFGDAFDPHLYRTLMNAVLRGEGPPVRIRPEDFEVYRLEQVSQASTVLMLDLSLSMAMRGNFLAAKKVALALDNLIRTQFPRDALYVVGFSTYAREVRPDALPYLGWDEYDPYTNIQHGLELSQRLLSRLSSGTKQIILISDGEPTAHLEAGQLFLQYPPSPRTIRETLREVKRCTRRGITINTFMLDHSSYLMEFVDQMTRINRGRVFYTSAERLGQYILVDYLNSRCRMLG